jgi:hypothetical protein
MEANGIVRRKGFTVIGESSRHFDGISRRNSFRNLPEPDSYTIDADGNIVVDAAGDYSGGGYTE